MLAQASPALKVAPTLARLSAFDLVLSIEKPHSSLRISIVPVSAVGLQFDTEPFAFEVVSKYLGFVLRLGRFCKALTGVNLPRWVEQNSLYSSSSDTR